jgi:hypothetical protein
MEYHLHHPITRDEMNILTPHINQAEGELSPKSRVNKSPGDDQPAACIRRPAPEGGRNINREFHPFQTRDKRAFNSPQQAIRCCPQVIGCRLLTFFAVWPDYQDTALFSIPEACGDPEGREDHTRSFR